MVSIEGGCGLNKILSYDNIAIVVLMFIAVQESFMIYYLLKNLFKIKEVLNKLRRTITILNERLNSMNNRNINKRGN